MYGVFAESDSPVQSFIISHPLRGQSGMKQSLFQNRSRLTGGVGFGQTFCWSTILSPYHFRHGFRGWLETSHIVLIGTSEASWQDVGAAVSISWKAYPTLHSLKSSPGVIYYSVENVFGYGLSKIPFVPIEASGSWLHRQLTALVSCCHLHYMSVAKPLQVN